MAVISFLYSLILLVVPPAVSTALLIYFWYFVFNCFVSFADFSLGNCGEAFQEKLVVYLVLMISLIHRLQILSLQMYLIVGLDTKVQCCEATHYN